MRTLVSLACTLAACGGAAQPVAPAPDPVAVAPAPPAPASAPVSEELTITSRSPDAVAEFKKGRDLNDLWRSEDAEPHFRKALAIDPDFAQAALYVGMVTSADDRPVMYARARDLMKTLPAPEAAYVEGMLLTWEANDVVAALPVLERAAATTPRDLHLQLAVSGAALGAERFDEAAGAMRAVLERDPRNAVVVEQLAYVEAYMGDTDAALAHVRQELGLTPDAPNAHAALGEILLIAGKIDESRAAFEAALQRSPGFVPAVGALALVELYAGNTRGAIERLKKAMAAASDPGDAIGFGEELGWIYAGEGNLDEVNKLYAALDKLAVAKKSDLVRAYAAARHGLVLAELGKAKEALAQAALVAQLAAGLGDKPQEVRSLRLVIGYTRLYAAGTMKRPADADKALADYDAAIRVHALAPPDQSALDTARALAALAKGNPKGAVAATERCSTFDAWCKFTHVAAQRAAGDTTGAAASLARLRASPRLVYVYGYYWLTMK